MRRHSLCLFLFLAMTAGSLFGVDAYFVRFNAYGRQVGLGQMLWSDDLLFYNTNASPVEVRFIGVSNGSAQADAPSLVLPPGRTISLGSTLVNSKWGPIGGPGLWILHLDVPSGVTVESRDEFYVTLGSPEFFPAPRGKVSMPVFAGLAPAGRAQVHLGTDLSGSESRINVGIYNAGVETASAIIEVRRTCDDTSVASQGVSVPPNTLIQVGGMSTGNSEGCTSAATTSWPRYTVVTVTQPSITFVSNVNENVYRAAHELGVVPVVGLAVTKSQSF